jgi:cytochrome c oxidase subunit 4
MHFMSHSSTPAKLHSASHGHHDVASEVRRYLIIFGALTVGTIVTVLASYINFGSPTMNIVVALSIASIKAFLVAGYFMHLISEKKMIYMILGSTTFFFAGLVYLTLWSMHPASFIHHQSYVP